ncbi:hypothetical protein [Agarivorans sp. JK6]|uniref:hypothetical protein n=1 Tax=Agarivorans sp. JK6 TaxID=2997426 RepID=UPI003873590D
MKKLTLLAALLVALAGCEDNTPPNCQEASDSGYFTNGLEQMLYKANLKGEFSISGFKERGITTIEHRGGYYDAMQCGVEFKYGGEEMRADFEVYAVDGREWYYYESEDLAMYEINQAWR